MPIRIDDNLPAREALENENIFVIRHGRARHQDIRPIKIAIVNLMPDKITTETQLLRLLSNTPLQVDIDLIQMSTHKSKNTSSEHMFKFYKTFDEIKEERYDGMIVTGAPVETMPFEQVDYWNELCEIFDWAGSHVYSLMCLCWGAMAGLYHYYNIPKYDLPEKMFGVFEHIINNPKHPLVKGFGDTFFAPHSRHTEVRAEDIEKIGDLEILAFSYISGVHIVSDKLQRRIFITGHGEYDRETLANEYIRDKSKGIDIHIPYNYFPNDNPYEMPKFNWCCHANLMFSNWLNYCVYQNTPYDLKDIQPI